MPSLGRASDSRGAIDKGWPRPDGRSSRSIEDVDVVGEGSISEHASDDDDRTISQQSRRVASSTFWNITCRRNLSPRTQPRSEAPDGIKADEGVVAHQATKKERLRLVSRLASESDSRKVDDGETGEV